MGYSIPWYTLKMATCFRKNEETPVDFGLFSQMFRQLLSGDLFSYNTYLHKLVGGLEHVVIFPYIGNVIIPTDELIFFRGVGIPPTR